MPRPALQRDRHNCLIAKKGSFSQLLWPPSTNPRQCYHLKRRWCTDIYWLVERALAWTGPGNGGDYITIVPEASADGKYGDYRPTSAGAELTVKAPDEAGPAEVRYMSGQGGLVLKRRPILIR